MNSPAPPRYAGAAVLICAVLMAVGAVWSVPVFVAAAVVNCGVVWLSWRRLEVSAALVIGVAILARLIVFPVGPTLSDDGYRYVWDGRLVVEGINPYAHPPSAPELAGHRDDVVYPRLNSPHYHSVYPPASQLIFATGALLSGGSFGGAWYLIKTLYLAIELLGVFLLVRMLSPRLAVLYAWHPLAVMETAGQGHAEGAMVGMLLIALWLVRHQRGALAGGALAVAGWLKLWPFLLIPFALRRFRDWRIGLGAGAVLVLLAAPFAAPYVIANVRESLDLYVRLFEWNAGPYFVVKGIGSWIVGEDVGKTVGPLLAGVFLMGLPIVWIIAQRRQWAIATIWFVVAAWFIVTATTVHPWYLLGVLALLPFVAHHGQAARLHVASWHVLAAGSIGTYLFYTHGEVPYWVAVTLGWGGWAILGGLALATACLPTLMRRRARRKWHWMRQHAPRGGRLLDLGAGEGFVGLEASSDGYDVHLADVVDFHRVDLPFTHIGSDRLPFEQNAFDGVLLAYVLHHSAHPERVLSEACRVASKRVIVLESVVETAWDRSWLPRADRLANRLRSNGVMEDRLDLRSAAAWRAAFASSGLRVVHQERSGGPFHRKALFVLEPDHRT